MWQSGFAVMIHLLDSVFVSSIRHIIIFPKLFINFCFWKPMCDLVLIHFGAVFLIKWFSLPKSPESFWSLCEHN
jgi:hypothetical protein